MRPTRLWVVTVGSAISLIVALAGPVPAASRDTSHGRPLRVLAANPRYFTDGSGRAVYLTGSHVWWNLVGGRTWGRCLGLAPGDFDFSGYLRRLSGHGHNFVRLWTIELLHWRDCGDPVTMDLLPWRRSGPGIAFDGRPKVDFRRLDPRYFARLRARVAAARRAHVYVSIMLFEGWSPQFERDGWHWRGSPYHPSNNVNGIDGDLDKDGDSDAHTLWNARITAFQDAYVRKVIDTVNAFDNVLFEIANEANVASTAWQYRMIRLIKRYEHRKPKRHPVGMTYQHGDPGNAALFNSAADWISPIGGNWVSAPPAASGRKVILLDTDHLCGVCGGSDFVWKSFMRGYNPIYMDPLDEHPERQSARAAMGRTRALGARVRLHHLRPATQRCSTRYCLGRLGETYIVYQPAEGAFSVELGRGGSYRAEWIHPTSGAPIRVAARRARGQTSFEAPWPGPAILYLHRSGR